MSSQGRTWPSYSKSLLIGKHLHSLAHAASSYQRVLEENRKLYNQVQDLKGKIPVAFLQLQ